jgi:NAD(P)H-nitrite reductase large subunit
MDILALVIIIGIWVLFAMFCIFQNAQMIKYLEERILYLEEQEASEINSTKGCEYCQPADEYGLCADIIKDETGKEQNRNSVYIYKDNGEYLLCSRTETGASTGPRN